MAFTTLLMFALAMVGTFFLEVRDQDTKWIFAELSGERVSGPARPLQHRRALRCHRRRTQPDAA